MGIATRIVRRLSAILLLSAPVLGQTQPELLHYRFDPPLDTDIVYAIEIKSAVVVPEAEHVERWTHEVVIRIDEKEGEEFDGTFEMRNVVNVENAEDDFNYLVAKALEGQRYSLTMLDFGMALELDWPAVEARIRERVPDLVEAEKAEIVIDTLNLIPDKTKVALRPIDAMGQAYVFSFRTDGELHRLEEAGLLTYLAMDPAIIEIGGGFDQQVGSYILDWLVTPASDQAIDRLSDELRSLATSLASGLGADALDVIEQGIAEGIEVAEDGYATYDLEKGLVTSATITALIASDPVAHATKITTTLISP